MKTLGIVTGPPASGKTHFGRKLARELDAAFLDIDTVTEILVKTSLQTLGKDPFDRDSPEFKSRFREPIYDTLFAIAAENLPFSNVVVSGPFTKELADAVWPEKIATKVGVPCDIRIYLMKCSEPERL